MPNCGVPEQPRYECIQSRCCHAGARHYSEVRRSPFCICTSVLHDTRCSTCRVTNSGTPVYNMTGVSLQVWNLLTIMTIKAATGWPLQTTKRRVPFPTLSRLGSHYDATGEAKRVLTNGHQGASRILPFRQEKAMTNKRKE